jgi:hypothetical protein
VKRQREPEDLFSSSIPQPSGAWKKIVDRLVLEEAHMQIAFESEIRRIRMKYTRLASSYDAVARDLWDDSFLPSCIYILVSEILLSVILPNVMNKKRFYGQLIYYYC